jgi:opacity protein-like surface antigen
MSVRTAVAISLLALSASVSAAFAQTAERSATRGFHIGASANGSSIELSDEDLDEELSGERESGPGLTLTAGYNFTSRLGLVLSASAANISSDDGDYTLGQGDLAARYSFASASRPFVPYVELGFTTLSAKEEFLDDSIELRGTGFTGALGANYFFTRKLALDVNFRYTKGEFDTIEIDGESSTSDDGVGVNTGRLNVGVSWFPGGGR